MAESIVKITSVMGGQTPAYYMGAEDGSTFLNSIAVDPEQPITLSDKKTGGALFPVGYSDFSGAAIAGAPMWIMTTNKNENVYVYTNNGDFVSYSSALASETDIGTPASGAGNGGAYYNNYIYLATPTDISRYGPLSGTPSLVDNFWTSTLGLSALTDTSYPTINGVQMPNHAMHVHSNGRLYIADYKDGQGVIHQINTKKSTYEGEIDDTTVPSQFNVLDLPFGYYPTDITSYGKDLAIVAIKTLSSTIRTGQAKVFFWDTHADSFYDEADIYDPLATAALTNNQALYVWSGNAVSGVRVNVFDGTSSFQSLVGLNDATPPFAGAVDAHGPRLLWGSTITQPQDAACVFAYGSKDPRIPMGLHNIARMSASGSNKLVTAMQVVQQDSNIQPKVVSGWRDGAGAGVDEYDATASLDATWRSQVFNVGSDFSIKELSIPFTKAIGANNDLTVKIYTDGGSNSETVRQITNSNFSNSEKRAVFTPEVRGNNDFFLELIWSGTDPLPVALPIVFRIESDLQFVTGPAA